MNIFAAIKLAFVIPFRVALGRASSTAAALSSIPMIYIYIYIYMYIIYIYKHLCCDETRIRDAV